MPELREIALEDARRRQADYRTDPWAARPILLSPCVIKILMVTDGFGSFGVADFGLHALLTILAVPPGPWVRFEVTKAHRAADPDADVQNVNFATHDLSAYDQIWLFAVDRAGSEIGDDEVAAIARFMDAGGGVFATGDHEDLGVSICGRIPRVRSMRKWYWPNPGPNGEPVAPKTDGPDRLDTLSAGNDPGVQFNDQSDDVPQRITPTLYSSWSWNPHFHLAHPHPLLCGPRGVIRVLPDHPHEGECYVPTDLTAQLTYAGYTTTEYPQAVAPEVVAWSTITGGRDACDVKGPINPRVFGAVGAYDGHRVDVGRVVVDATWHHFFDINLIGELGNPDVVKGVGFDATPTGHAAYEEIKAYFRNIAVWLASEQTQRCMWWRALWWCRWHHRIAMDLRPDQLRDIDTLDLDELQRVGHEARDALGRLASRCTVLRWISWYLVRPQWPGLWREFAAVLDPWQPDRGRVATAALGLQAEQVWDALMGAAVYALGAQFPTADAEARKRVDDDAGSGFDDLVAGHLRHAMRSLGESASRDAQQLATFSELLR
jgi:hypothetical protein